MTVLTVSSEARADAPLRLGAATLPSSFRYTEDRPDVFSIVGRGDWISQVIRAVEDGARGVLVAHPETAVPARLDDLQELLTRSRIPLVLDRGWAAAPAAELAAPEFAAVLDRTALVETRLGAAPGASVVAALEDQLALLRACVAEFVELRVLRADTTGYDALGVLEGGAAVDVTGVFSDPLNHGVSVRVVRPSATVRLELGTTDIAAPGLLHVLTGAVERRLLTPYETPHRNAWRRFAAAVEVGEPTMDLVHLARDQRIVHDALRDAGVGA